MFEVLSFASSSNWGITGSELYPGWSPDWTFEYVSTEWLSNSVWADWDFESVDIEGSFSGFVGVVIYSSSHAESSWSSSTLETLGTEPIVDNSSRRFMSDWEILLDWASD